MKCRTDGGSQGCRLLISNGNEFRITTTGTTGTTTYEHLSLTFVQPNMGTTTTISLFKNGGASDTTPLYFDDAYLWDLGAGPEGASAGMPYKYSTSTTNSDPGNGFFRFDSTTISAVTKLRISEVNRDTTNLAAYLATWDDLGTTTNRGTLFIRSEIAATPQHQMVFQVTGTLTDNGAWDTFDITFLSSSASGFSSSDPWRLLFVPAGIQGATGPTGATGATGATGPAGADGFNSLVATTAEGAGANCANAGRKIESGLDNGDGGGTARDGILQAGEVDHTAYVCNGQDGTDGADGFTALVDTTTEPPGANCATGGIKVESGLDDDRDGTLDPGEIDETTYVCNGATGATGPQGPAGPQGPQGPAGAAGTGSNLTVRLLFGPVEEDVPIPIYAQVEEHGIPTNASENVTIQISTVVGATVWDHDVFLANMAQVGSETGLYVYEWPGAMGRYSVRVNGTAANGSFTHNVPILVTEDGVETQSGGFPTVTALPGYTDGQTLALIIFGLAFFLLAWKNMWPAAGTAALSFIVVAFVPSLPAIDDDWSMVVSVLLTFMVAAGNVFYVRFKQAQQATRPQEPAP
jgi:hypothetical protein